MRNYKMTTYLQVPFSTVVKVSRHLDVFGAVLTEGRGGSRVLGKGGSNK